MEYDLYLIWLILLKDLLEIWLRDYLIFCILFLWIYIRYVRLWCYNVYIKDVLKKMVYIWYCIKYFFNKGLY